MSRCGAAATALTGTAKQMGKGASPAQAEASAIMELAERFSFFSFCRNPAHFTIDTYANLKKEALPFEAIARSVHDTSGDLEAAARIFETIPMRWTRAWNLTAGGEVLVPFDWFYAINEFNGPSAGNCQEEALSQGICEIVERHVSSIVSRAKRRTPAIDPASAKDPMVRTMLQKYENNGINLYVQDLSLDTGIPTVGVFAYDPASFPGSSELVWTAGTTPNPEKAFSRALTEVAQLAGDFNSGTNYVASGLPKYVRLEQAAFLMRPEETVRLDALPDLSHDNIRIEVENLVGALARNSMEVLVINTMHPQLEIPAFYTIVPGTHFRERAQGTSVGMFSAKLVVENQPPDIALYELEKFESLLPGRYYLQFYMGLCHLNAGRPETALGHFQQALERGPVEEDIPSIYSYMGVCLKDTGRYREALEVLRRGLAMDEERTDLHNLMGFCHFQLKEHEQAIGCFERVIRLNPGSAIDYANIASNYRDLNRPEDAIRYYRMALEIDPTIEFARDNLARLAGSASPE